MELGVSFSIIAACYVDPGRALLSNVQFVGCASTEPDCMFAALEDVVIDDAETGSVRITDCLFKHVVLRGRFDTLFFRAGDFPLRPHPAEYYENVDWALDIRQAEFEEVTLDSGESTLETSSRPLGSSFRACGARAHALLDNPERRADSRRTRFEPLAASVPQNARAE